MLLTYKQCTIQLCCSVPFNFSKFPQSKQQERKPDILSISKLNIMKWLNPKFSWMEVQHRQLESLGEQMLCHHWCFCFFSLLRRLLSDWVVTLELLPADLFGRTEFWVHWQASTLQSCDHSGHRESRQLSTSSLWNPALQRYWPRHIWSTMHRDCQYFYLCFLNASHNGVLYTQSLVTIGISLDVMSVKNVADYFCTTEPVSIDTLCDGLAKRV